MQTPRRTRSSVLGKRSPQDRDVSPTRVGTDKGDELDQLPTPQQTPKLKRARTMVLEDGTGNKENIPPFRTQSLLEMSPSSGRATRSLRRTTSLVNRVPSSM
jgi:cell division control protein 6